MPLGVFLLVTIVFLIMYLAHRGKGKLPPGRWGLPLIGYLPLIDKRSFEDQLQGLHKEHGDIYIWRIGTQLMLFLHNHHLAREAFTRSDFVNRPKWDRFTLMENKPLGISASNGHIWDKNRRFSLRVLKDLGMGKSKMTSAVQLQARKLVEALKLQAGKAKPVPQAVRTANLNAIWYLIAGKTFEMDDPQIKEFGKLFNDINDSAIHLNTLDFFPWLKNLPKSLQRRYFHLGALEQFKEKFLKYFQDEIMEHKASLDPDNPRDLIDSYLVGMGDKEGDSSDSGNESDLAVLMMDLFVAGTELTPIVITFMMYYMAMYPDVQRKVQEEIDSALPRGTLATLEDRSRLRYTEAVIHEVLRVTCLDPIGVQRCAVKDTQLAGFNIPKGTVVNIAVVSIHHDQRYWEEPEKFLPERWLDEDGKLTRREGFFPFGVGKRVCIGEALARMELLIFSTAVFQSLSISPPPGTLLDLAPDPCQPMIHNPKPQDIYVTVRP